MFVCVCLCVCIFVFHVLFKCIVEVGLHRIEQNGMERIGSKMKSFPISPNICTPFLWWHAYNFAFAKTSTTIKAVCAKRMKKRIKQRNETKWNAMKEWWRNYSTNKTNVTDVIKLYKQHCIFNADLFTLLPEWFLLLLLLLPFLLLFFPRFISQYGF